VREPEVRVYETLACQAWLLLLSMSYRARFGVAPWLAEDNSEDY